MDRERLGGAVTNQTNKRGRPRVSAELLKKAASECRQRRGSYFQSGRLVWWGVREAARKYAVGESTLRRFLADSCRSAS